MSKAKQRVRQAMQDACDDGRDYHEDMVWDGDMLVPCQYDSPLDKETLDEQRAHGMGPSWEERRDSDE